MEEDLSIESPQTLYRPVCPPAVLSVVLGALSILTVFSWYLVFVPIAGIILGWRAIEQVRAAPREWSGLKIARLGIALSAALWAVGYGWLIFAQVREVPPGYERITYEDLQPNPNDPANPIPEKARDMQDKRVYVKGFMQPRREQTGIKEFILVPYKGDCPFCLPDPKRTEKIRITLKGDLQAAYTTAPVGVAGRFQIESTDPAIPYCIEASYLH